VNDRGLSVLEQYNLKVKNTYRGRGSLICETDQGLKLIKEYNNSKLKLAFQNKVLKQIRQLGYEWVDLILENTNGEIISKDKDDIPYIVKDWYNGLECDTKSERDILKAVETMAKIHKMMKIAPKADEVNVIHSDIKLEFEKHNRELKKVQNFIRDKHKKNEFEISFMLEFNIFFAQGQEVSEQLNHSSYQVLKEAAMQQGQICHGAYNHHNVLFIKEGVAVTNFERLEYDIHIGDLYNFMRKIMEKNNWNESLGKNILESYNKVRPISTDELMNLYYRLSYPEKFWKMANHYYNSNKAWIPGKNVEKIKKLVKQDKNRKEFLEKML
jgi:spore coat protein, CotS family